MISTRKFAAMNKFKRIEGDVFQNRGEAPRSKADDMLGRNRTIRGFSHEPMNANPASLGREVIIHLLLEVSVFANAIASDRHVPPLSRAAHMALLELRAPAILMRAADPFNAFVPCLLTALKLRGDHFRIGTAALYAPTVDRGKVISGLAQTELERMLIHAALGAPKEAGDNRRQFVRIAPTQDLVLLRRPRRAAHAIHQHEARTITADQSMSITIGCISIPLTKQSDDSHESRG